MIESSFEAQMDKYASLVADIVKKNKELFDSMHIDDTDKNILRNLKNRKGQMIDLKKSLYRISQCLQQHYHKKVIILIDEYDVPLHAAYRNGYYDEMVNFLKTVFSRCV